MPADPPPDTVNDRVIEEWKDDTTAGERVRSVIKRTYTPQPVATIAERAQTSETTARRHLRSFVDEGSVKEVPDERGTLYRRATRAIVLERAQQLLSSVDSDMLAVRVSEMQETVREYQELTNAETPRAAAINDAELDTADLKEWQTTYRNLKIARAALALADAEDTVQTDGQFDGEPDITEIAG